MWYHGLKENDKLLCIEDDSLVSHHAFSGEIVTVSSISDGLVFVYTPNSPMTPRAIPFWDLTKYVLEKDKNKIYNLDKMKGYNEKI